jgi:hypothetical protein
MVQINAGVIHVRSRSSEASGDLRRHHSPGKIAGIHSGHPIHFEQKNPIFQSFDFLLKFVNAILKHGHNAIVLGVNFPELLGKVVVHLSLDIVCDQKYSNANAFKKYRCGKQDSFKGGHCKYRFTFSRT